MPRISPRFVAGVVAAPLLALALAATACGASNSGGSNGSEGPWSAQAITKSQSNGAVIPQLINSQVGRGPTRLAFALFERDGSLVQDASDLKVRLYTLDGDQGKPVGDEHPLTQETLRERLDHKHPDGSIHVHDDPVATVYVTNADLIQGQWWGASMSATVGGKQYQDMRVRFFVGDKTLEPAIGDPVPPTTQRVLRDVPDITQIDSSQPPIPELHQLTVAEAIKTGKPTVVAFATPAFCQTRFCGPVVDSVIVPLLNQYRDRVQFIHIEPYLLDQARAGKLVPIPELQQWGLTTEPWVFVLDGSGHVAAKFEGITSQDEVGAALERVLAAKS